MHMHPSFRYELCLYYYLFRWLVVVVDRSPPHLPILLSVPFVMYWSAYITVGLGVWVELLN